MHFPTKLPSHRVLCRFMITERIAIFRALTNFTLWLYSRRGMNLNSRERTKIHYKPCNLDAFLCAVGRASDLQSDGRALLSNIQLKFHVQNYILFRSGKNNFQSDDMLRTSSKTWFGIQDCSFVRGQAFLSVMKQVFPRRPVSSVGRASDF